MIIGIDLGTTNSLIAVWNDCESKLIPNVYGSTLTPSVVGIDDDGSIIVGAIAKERLLTHPHLTIANFKRFMGTQKKYKLGKKTYRPEELSSLVLRQLKKDAEIFLGSPIDEVIISVPAYFNDTQRNATRMAGILAELKVERIINEPTAVGLAYGLHEKNKETKFLVFDLGGGTFDVSIIELFNGIMEIRASTGNNHLGGEDFTEVIMFNFLKQHDLLNHKNLESFKPILRKKSEELKLALSHNNQAELELFFDGQKYNWLLTNEKFTQQCNDLLQKLKTPIERALRDAKIQTSELESIILAGGSTRMPIIKSLVAKLFGKIPLAYLNPDEVVAIGASVQAGLKKRDRALNDIVVTDVCPYTLGTAVLDESQSTFYLNYLPIIERNTVIPVSKVVTVTNAQDHQKEIQIDVYQGESHKPSENIHLGKLNIAIPRLPKGEAKIDIRYTYDINGLLEIEATILNTEEKFNKIIHSDNNLLSPEQIQERLKELNSLKIHPRESAKNRWLMARVESLFIETTGDLRKHINDIIILFNNALNTQDPILIAKAQEKLEVELTRIETDLRIM